MALDRPDDYHPSEHLRDWRENHPELWLAQQKRQGEIERRRGYPTTQKRRAMMFGAFIEHVDKRVIYEACHGLCEICEEPVSLKAATLDHIIPLCRGGLHCYENIRVAHDYCNRRKGRKLIEEMDDDLRYAPVPQKGQPYFNSKSYRQANAERHRRAA